MAGVIPAMALRSGVKGMPVIGLGTVGYPALPVEAMKSAFLEAIAAGYRHFDTAAFYGSEPVLGNAIAEALRRGLVESRDEIFITTKLWITDAHAGSVIPALRESLRGIWRRGRWSRGGRSRPLEARQESVCIIWILHIFRLLQLDYVDLYLVHFPVSVKSSKVNVPFLSEHVFPMDMKSVWEEMEECHKLGLAKYIGVSNFSCKKLDQILAIANIPPAVNQVEMHPLWQQKKLNDFCKAKGILVSAYSPLGANGAPWGTSKVMECRELKKIASSRGKSIAQICLRWIYEQDAIIVVKTFNKERMKENLDIFDWKLSEEDLHMIHQLPQYKGCRGVEFLNANGGFKSLEEFWDGEI